MKKQLLFSLLILSHFASTLAEDPSAKSLTHLILYTGSLLHQAYSELKEESKPIDLASIIDQCYEIYTCEKEISLLHKKINLRLEEDKLKRLTQRVKDLVETCHTMQQKESYLTLFNSSNNA